MTTRAIIKDISVHYKSGRNTYVGDASETGFDVLEIRHENKLTLDTIIISYYTVNLALITYGKPYVEKYLGLVIEWIVNNRKQVGHIGVNRQSGTIPR